MRELHFGGDRGVFLGAVLAATLALGCGASDGGVEVEENLGPIDQLVDEVDSTVWPGNVKRDGSRHVRRINAFFQDAPAAYWFAGFGPRIPADVFWFCREGDTACPFTPEGVLDRSHTIGDPVFSRMPAENGFSPFWRVWRVDVGPDYQANDIKSVAGIDRASAEGRLKVEAHIHDFGEEIGPEMTLMHCLLVLTGTTLEFNGEDAINEPGVPTVTVPKQHGWHLQHQLEFFEFTVSDGIFPPAEDSESFAIFPFSDIFVLFRDCSRDEEGVPASDSVACDFTTSVWSAVSERGVEEDITGDGDEGDANNIISGFPGRDNPDPLDLIYSPEWRVLQVNINIEHDEDVKLIDTSQDQNVTDAMVPATLRDWVAKEWVQEPKPISEEFAGNAIEGNDESIFFNCPAIKVDR